MGHTPEPVRTSDEESSFWHQAANRAAGDRRMKLLVAFESGTGKPVSDPMKAACGNIAWTCSGTTIDTLIHEFSTLISER